jgi:hypothetical protein
MPQATDVQQGDLDFAGFRAFGPRAPVTADDIARYGDLSLGIASSAALSALTITSGMDTGLPKWVATRRRLFMLDKTAAAATLPAEPGNVIVAADGVSRWLAMPTPDAYWNSRTSWLVRPVAGDDEASTASAKTLRELNRRLYGSLYDFQAVITVDADVPLSDTTILHNVRSVNGIGFPTMIGTKTQIGGDYVISSVVPTDPAASGGGTGYIVNATGIGDSANLGRLIETTDGVVCSWIQDNPTANQVRVTAPTDADPIAGTVGISRSLVGRTVRVYSLTRLPVYPFGPLAGFSGLGWMKFGYAGGGPDFGYGIIGPASPFIARCESEGAIMNGGVNGDWSACMFTVNGSTPSTLSTHQSIVHYSGVRGGDVSVPGLYLQSGSVLICESQSANDPPLDIQGSIIKVEYSKLGADFWPLSAYGCTAGESVLRLVGQGEIRVSNIWGRGNTVRIISTTNRGGTHYVGANNFGTSAAHLARIAGEDQDLPLSDVSTGTFIAGAA